MIGDLTPIPIQYQIQQHTSCSQVKNLKMHLKTKVERHEKFRQEMCPFLEKEIEDCPLITLKQLTQKLNFQFNCSISKETVRQKLDQVKISFSCIKKMN